MSGLSPLAWILIFICGSISIFELWKQKRDESQPFLERQRLRIPLSEFASHARDNGWDLGHPRTSDIKSFLNGLEQAGQDGLIQFWGAKKQNHNTPSDRLLPISSEFWAGENGYLKAHINTFSLFDFDKTMGNGREDIWERQTNNMETYTTRYSRSGAERTDYCNLQLNRQQAMHWLEVEAPQYRRTNDNA